MTAGLSREEMARELDVDPGTITRWETDRAGRVKPAVMMAYALRCGVLAVWIMLGDEAAAEAKTTVRSRWFSRPARPDLVLCGVVLTSGAA